MRAQKPFCVRRKFRKCLNLVLVNGIMCVWNFYRDLAWCNNKTGFCLFRDSIVKCIDFSEQNVRIMLVLWSGRHY
ncbi:hypothetical protein STSP2_01031 [Anaerohalosphaera lusitana]|uniref:Uncharacterized protein n=1 Tax=Anaerohalosphaera lusitana TaxID=1936003 RepID=A0A1U9NIX0_9BACT|nr:hypothetical protein STSP2_01031 [Anaerohalosphaera lusitana]